MYIYIAIPLIAFAIAQTTKVLLKSRHQKLNLKNLFAYSDMPSGHTAIVSGLAMIIALKEGISSPLFALSFVFASVVITDAVGLRTYLGQHGKTLNVLVKDLKEDEFLDRSYPKQLEHIGHTPLQVIIGGLIGVTVACLGYLLF